MVFEKLRDIICQELAVAPESVTMDSDLRKDFDADSLDLVDIVMDIEDRFNVEIPEDSMETMATVKDVVEYIQANI